MEMFIKYLLWSGIGITLFYLIDILLLRRSNLIKVERGYIIVAILLSLIIPLVSPYIPRLHSIMESVNLPEIIITYETPIKHSRDWGVSLEETFILNTWSYLWWIDLIQVIWLIGAGITTLRLIIGLITLHQLIKGSEKRKIGEATLCLTKRKIAPFTFGKIIVVDRTLAHQAIFESIIRHELEHVRQKHYMDLSLGVLLQLLQWWNPFAWGLLHNQRNTLEFLADQSVLKTGVDKRQYQLHLLEGATGRSIALPRLSFSVQNIKKRIFMMNNQTKKHLWAGVCSTLAIPLIATFLLIGTQLISTKPAVAQESNSLSLSQVVQEDEKVYDVAKHLPTFPGGTSAMFEFLNNNVSYPKEAQEKGIEGKVTVSFVVKKDGSITNIKVEKSVHPLLDDEAIKVVSLMPNWEPGKNEKQKPVNVRMTLPIHFRASKKAQDDGHLGINQEDETVYEKVEDMPKYPGGEKAMFEFLSQNVRYPVEAQKKNIQGRVMVAFVVRKDGTISNVEVIKSIHETLDTEAVRVVKLMPNWEPGKHKGKKVSTKCVIPINFSLKGSKK